MAEYRATVNIAGAKAGGPPVDRDPDDPRTIALVGAGILVPLDPDLLPPKPAVESPGPKPKKRRSPLVTTASSKAKIKDAMDGGDIAAAQAEVLAGVEDVFGDRDGENPEAQVEVEGSPEADPES